MGTSASSQQKGSGETTKEQKAPRQRGGAGKGKQGGGQHHPHNKENQQRHNKGRNSGNAERTENEKLKRLKISFLEPLKASKQKPVKDSFHKAVENSKLHKDVDMSTCKCKFLGKGKTLVCEFAVSTNQLGNDADAILDAIKKSFKEGLGDVEIEDAQWLGGAHKKNHGALRGSKHKGKHKKRDKSASSSSTIKALAAVICVLLLGLLVVFMYRFFCKKKLETVLTDTPKNNKSKGKKTKKHKKLKFEQLENNFSSSSEEDRGD